MLQVGPSLAVNYAAYETVRSAWLSRTNRSSPTVRERGWEQRARGEGSGEVPLSSANFLLSSYCMLDGVGRGLPGSLLAAEA